MNTKENKSADKIDPIPDAVKKHPVVQKAIKDMQKGIKRKTSQLENNQNLPDNTNKKSRNR